MINDKMGKNICNLNYKQKVNIYNIQFLKIKEKINGFMEK